MWLQLLLECAGEGDGGDLHWVVSMFEGAMDGKRPIEVIMEGDLAMCNAIRNIFSDARH